jgi:pimeloyl-ACP methyl ester carboxylesterase
MKKNKAWKWIQVILLVYFLIGAMFYFFQEKIIFNPKKLKEDYRYHFEIPFRQVDHPVTAEKNLSIVQFTVPDSLRKGIVLYFHGNRGNINRYAPNAGSFTRNGYDVWMIDYPGFGKTTGKRNEKTIYEDALIFYKMAISQVTAEKIILYGRSLGSGIAAQLASIRDCNQLILETPYYSMAALAKHYFVVYPVNLFIKYDFPTFQYLDGLKIPITIFHGTRDGVIPFAHAKKLKEKFPNINLIRIEKGRHNNLASFPLYQQKLDSLLSK